jgi:hypothetical protein
MHRTVGGILIVLTLAAPTGGGKVTCQYRTHILAVGGEHIDEQIARRAEIEQRSRGLVRAWS